MHLILFVFSFVCLVISLWGPATPHWNRLVSAGLAFLVASMISW